MDENKMKVVFRDADSVKVAYGSVSFENDFIKVTDVDDKTRYILINKNTVISMKTGGK